MNRKRLRTWIMTRASMLEDVTNALRGLGINPADVLMESTPNGYVRGIRLFEETLTDGSKVYTLQFTCW